MDICGPAIFHSLLTIYLLEDLKSLLCRLDVSVKGEKWILCQTAEILSQLQEQERQEWEKGEKKERLSRSLLSMLQYTVQDTDEERQKI